MGAQTTINVFDDVSVAVRSLSRKDAALRAAAKAIERPHIRRREGGFAGIFRIIVEQQVSVPSAQAIWTRCSNAVDVASPVDVSELDVEGLRALGLTRPKARYVLGVADAIENDGFRFSVLADLPDQAAMERLIEFKGVGPWTAAIYLLFCEGRADIWPARDVALKHAYNAAAARPLDQSDLDEKAAAWAPWRGVAAHILWTYYAHLKGRTPI